jgi:hypothetical protein
MYVEIEFKDVLFTLEECEDFLEITANDGLQSSGCFVRKNGVIDGHYGYFDGGFTDPEVERFAQDVFDKEIAEWCNEK